MEQFWGKVLILSVESHLDAHLILFLLGDNATKQLDSKNSTEALNVLNLKISHSAQPLFIHILFSATDQTDQRVFMTPNSVCVGSPGFGCTEITCWFLCFFSWDLLTAGVMLSSLQFKLGEAVCCFRTDVSQHLTI